MSKDHYIHREACEMQNTTKFDTAEEAWFWFIQASEAKNSGARIVSGKGRVTRPCEPSDIYNVLNRLYRSRRLNMNHLRVLKHYGVRMMPPDYKRSKEARSYHIWREAMRRLQDALQDKGIVEMSTGWPKDREWAA